MLQYISLCCLRFENNIEGEGLQVAFGLVHLMRKVIMLIIAIVIMMMTLRIFDKDNLAYDRYCNDDYPYLAFSGELND